jgi:tetratricopeptide (TPR) repeat protein
LKKREQSDKPSTESTAQSRQRRKWFRIFALLVPIGFLVLLELILRAVGFGYPTEFFLRTKLNGREIFVENQQFSKRYFPPGLERAPQTIRIDAAKAPNTIRIFVFGESAAMGDPEPAYGFPRILEVILRDAMPDKRIEVINVALTAINSHVIRDIARSCADKQGDYWITYMGNNEVVGPFGAGTVFGSQVPARSLVRANLAIKTTRLGQLIDSIRWRLTNRGKERAWEGMEMFLQQRVPANDPRLSRTYENFGINLRDILDLAEKSGARVLLSTVAVNLKDCAPFASEEPTGRSLSGTTDEWRKHVANAHANLQSTNITAAMDEVAQATRMIHPGQSEDYPANLYYLQGCAYVGANRTNEARSSFERALTMDALRFRADAEVNKIIREASRGRPNCHLVDVEGDIAAQSPYLIPGEEFFYEHVHFNFDGNYAVARHFASEILGTTNQSRLASRQRCAEALAYTDFDRHRVLDEVRQRLEQPPFSQQIDHEARAVRIKQRLALTEKSSFTAAKAMYERAIAERPGDWVLRESFGTLLKDLDLLNDALAQWMKVVELVPHSADGCLGLANTLDAMGRPAEAIAWFRRGLLLRPNSIETRNGLGLALSGAGDPNGAIKEFAKALRYNPDFTEARVNLGHVLAQQGRISEARDQYVEALRRNSNSVPAHINLGRLFASQNNPTEAAIQYREAIRLKPDHAIAHYNLGNALGALGDHAGAFAHYSECARLQPTLTEARYRFGLGLARQGRNDAAVIEFAEVVRQNPNHADGHFNLGVALAKLGRFAEAATQFEETLKLQPDNDQAKKFLEQAKARQEKRP